MTNSQKISQIILALRALFKDKDRLIGVDDWDTFIGVLMLLEEVGNDLQSVEIKETTVEE